VCDRLVAGDVGEGAAARLVDRGPHVAALIRDEHVLVREDVEVPALLDETADRSARALYAVHLARDLEARLERGAAVGNTRAEDDDVGWYAVDLGRDPLRGRNLVERPLRQDVDAERVLRLSLPGGLLQAEADADHAGDSPELLARLICVKQGLEIHHRRPDLGTVRSRRGALFHAPLDTCGFRRAREAPPSQLSAQGCG